MQKNEFNNNTISDSTIYNYQTNIVNGQVKIPIDTCINKNSKNYCK